MKRVLVANRGEIAVRIIRALRESGYESVAVFSEPDRLSPHVRTADRAVPIGPAAPAESYLNIARLLDAARDTGADAIHPGYGFLAERPDFARAVTDAGFIWIGPPAAAISAMGNKTEARRLMQKASVPVVPGTVEPLESEAELSSVAGEIGFPLMLKAVAGGGGKGMRLVRSTSELGSAFTQARSEALKAFGDDSVYVEKYIERPRHVEIQVIADACGNVFHMGERECSVQRRHQKLIEECPSPAIDEKLRREMGTAAVQAARSVGYVGAGTVEFLLDRSGEFYFLEMNTRIQVEHPVTELVYGVDLVRDQLTAACGEPLPESYAALQPRGHSIECRIVAEDPYDGFLPQTGRLEHLEIPCGPGIRWDGAIERGMEIGLSYDPLLAKLIVWAEDRDRAIARMNRALDELLIVGVPTSVPLARAAMQEESFRAGRYDIGYLDTHPELLEEPLSDAELTDLAIAAALSVEACKAVPRAAGSHGRAPVPSRWLTQARRDGLR